MVIRATPRLSIGLPVYDGGGYLIASLEALLGQTYEDFELIISDNPSMATPSGLVCETCEVSGGGFVAGDRDLSEALLVSFPSGNEYEVG